MQMGALLTDPGADGACTTGPERVASLLWTHRFSHAVAPSERPADISIETQSIRAVRTLIALDEDSAPKIVEEALRDPMTISGGAWTARIRGSPTVGLAIEYERLHLPRAVGPKRVPTLTITPAERVSWKFPTIKELDQELLSHTEPYDGFADLLADLGVPIQLTELEQKPLVEVVLFAPADIDTTQSGISGGKLSLAVTMHPALEPSKLRIGIKAFPSNSPAVRRSSFGGDELSWSRESAGDVVRTTHTADLPNVPIVLAIVSYDGEYMGKWWVRDTALSFNDRLQLHRCVDTTDQFKKTFFEDRNDFEDRVALLLTLLNLTPLKYGEIEHLTDAPDMLALSTGRHLYVIDCTTGDINSKGKLLRLHERTKKIRETLSQSAQPPIAVLPIVFTSLPRQETAIHWQTAAAFQIAIVARENIVNILDRLDVPPMPEDLYQSALSFVPPPLGESAAIQRP
jgi:hypothetical protein